MNVTVLTLVAAPWWAWLYVVAIGLICAAAFAISHFWRDPR